MNIPAQLKKHRLQRNRMIFLSFLLTLGYWLTDHWLWLIAGLLLINLYALVLMGIDKRMSQKENAFRIPEKSFYLLALFLGSLGVCLGIALFRHKSHHRSFKLLALLIPLQYGLLYWLLLLR